MKNLMIACLVVVSLVFVGCGAAGMERSFGMGNCTIEMYSGGKLVQTWESSGRVKSEDNSDGWYFRDKATGKLVIVTGDVVIKNK
jgi:hypothetical protein